MNVPFKKWQRKYAENENALQSIWLNVLKEKKKHEPKQRRWGSFYNSDKFNIDLHWKERITINKRKWLQLNPIASHLCHQIEIYLLDCIRLG